MRVMVCLLGSLAVGCATYLLGAVVWSVFDPFGAGKVLLFTIPIAIAAMGLPGLLAVVGMVNLCNWKLSRRRRLRRSRPHHVPDTNDAIDMDDLRFAA